jgi:hypothetical protein
MDNYLKNDLSTLTKHTVGFFESWGRSENFLAQMSYETVDALYVSASTFMPWRKVQHLDGQYAFGDDKAKAFAAAVMTLIPEAPKGTQTHHIIPRQLFEELNLGQYGFNLDHVKNLIDLPTPFHGNHPSYTRYVRKEIGKLQEVTLEGLIDIQTEMTKQIQRIHSSGASKLNKFYKDLGF